MSLKLWLGARTPYAMQPSSLEFTRYFTTLLVVLCQAAAPHARRSSRGTSRRARGSWRPSRSPTPWRSCC